MLWEGRRGRFPFMHSVHPSTPHLQVLKAVAVSGDVLQLLGRWLKELLEDGSPEGDAFLSSLLKLLVRLPPGPGALNPSMQGMVERLTSKGLAHKNKDVRVFAKAVLQVGVQRCVCVCVCVCVVDWQLVLVLFGLLGERMDPLMDAIIMLGSCLDQTLIMHSSCIHPALITMHS